MTHLVEKNEKQIWNAYFAEALDGCGQEMENSNLWWSISEIDTVDIVYDIFKAKTINVLEAGCGSGGTNFSLGKKLKLNQIDLLDISVNALKYAKQITPPEYQSKTRYILGSILDEKIEELGKYDLVWNTGLIEHYTPKEIISIISHMLDYTNEHGVVILGIPNIKSIAVLKAAFLGTRFARKFLKFINGYRNSSEILYSDRQIKKLISDHFKNVRIELKYAGSPLLVGSPEFLVRLVNQLFRKTKFSFLSYFILYKE